MCANENPVYNSLSSLDKSLCRWVIHAEYQQYNTVFMHAKKDDFFYVKKTASMSLTVLQSQTVLTCYRTVSIIPVMKMFVALSQIKDKTSRPTQTLTNNYCYLYALSSATSIQAGLKPTPTPSVCSTCCHFSQDTEVSATGPLHQKAVSSSGDETSQFILYPSYQNFFLINNCIN